MPMTCTVCRHKSREAIDAALVEGKPNRRIATQFKLTEAALRRHKAEHLPQSLMKAKEAEQAAQADDLLARLDALDRDAQRIKEKAEKAKDYRAALGGIREQERIVELLEELRGQLNRTPLFNILLSTEWVTIRTVVMRALGPYPEARQAVVRALRNGHADK